MSEHGFLGGDIGPGRQGSVGGVLTSIFPEAERRIPWNNQTDDTWVIEDNPLFDTQWVQCFYQISGGYGPTPRYLFYALILFAVITRRNAWIVTAALGSVMTYSATAAVHAVVLVTLRTRIAPKYIFNEWLTVLVNGTSATGLNDNSGDSPLWLPILPMAWDNDADPVLAIVGTAFLALLPMQLWSTTFKRSDAKAVLFLWSGLLLVGIVSALINSAYLNFWAFPQLRFCPPGLNDTLPFMNNGALQSEDVQWEQLDSYYWNRTVYDYFRNPNNYPGSACIYPCFSSSWPLRDPSEITVVAGSTGNVADTNTAWSLLLAVYILVCSSFMTSLTVFAINVSSQPPKQMSTAFEKIHNAFRHLSTICKIAVPTPMLKVCYIAIPSRTSSGANTKTQEWIIYLKHQDGRPRKLFSSAKRLYARLISFYAKVVSPVALLFFVVWIEWFIWANDPGGESFKHVGQWGAVVAVVIVGLAALVGRLSSADNPVADIEFPQSM